MFFFWWLSSPYQTHLCRYPTSSFMTAALWWLKSPQRERERAVEQQKQGVQALPGAPRALQSSGNPEAAQGAATPPCLAPQQHHCTVAVLLNPHHSQECPSFHLTRTQSLLQLHSSRPFPLSRKEGRKELFHTLSPTITRSWHCPWRESPHPWGGRASVPGVTSQQCPCSSLPSSGTFLLQRICRQEAPHCA